MWTRGPKTDVEFGIGTARIVSLQWFGADDGQGPLKRTTFQHQTHQETHMLYIAVDYLQSVAKLVTLVYLLFHPRKFSAIRYLAAIHGIPLVKNSYPLYLPSLVCVNI